MLFMELSVLVLSMIQLRRKEFWVVCTDSEAVGGLVRRDAAKAHEGTKGIDYFVSVAEVGRVGFDNRLVGLVCSGTADHVYRRVFRLGDSLEENDAHEIFLDLVLLVDLYQISVYRFLSLDVAPCIDESLFDQTGIHRYSG